MRDTRGGLFCYLILALLLSPFATGNGGDRSFNCDPSKAEEQCRKNERCVQDSKNPAEGYCECERGFKHYLNECVQTASTVIDNVTTVEPDVDTTTGGGGSSVAAGLLIPTFLILSGALLYFGARRYKWLQRFRQYRQNRYGNVLVTRDDDDDDVPPIP